MNRTNFVLSGCLFASLVACGRTGGPAPIGPDRYMLSATGPPNWSSGGALKGDLVQQAAAFCRGQGKELIPAREFSIDASFGRLAQAEIEFHCLPRGDPGLRRPG